MNGSGTLLRIVPAGTKNGATKTQGTKVMVGEKELTGVSRIELFADTNGVWQAVVHCHVILDGDLVAEADLIPIKRDRKRGQKC